MKNILVLTVGLPRAGKTTWARAQGKPIVNPDAIRYAIHGKRYLACAEKLVWTAADLMVRSLFHAGHTLVILDATNISRKRRDEWKTNKLWETWFRVFDTPVAVSLERAFGDTEIHPVIIRMANEWHGLDEDEQRFTLDSVYRFPKEQE